jgi:hypothetical protein
MDPGHDRLPAERAGSPPSPGDPAITLRPFVLTTGRVSGADQEICLETQVTSNLAETRGARFATANLASELRAIIALCGQPTSVAEISARLRLHLGVTKILVGDLRAAGHLEIHPVNFSDPHSPETILRVMRGLRAIT